MIDYITPTPAWRDALKRADDQWIRCWPSKDRPSTPDAYRFDVSSSEEPALPCYTVDVLADVNGIHVECTCDGGRNFTPCKHASRVLSEMGHLVIDEPTPQPEPTPLHIHQLQGRYSLALLNGDDVAEDAARAELRTLGVMA